MHGYDRASDHHARMRTYIHASMPLFDVSCHCAGIGNVKSTVRQRRAHSKKISSLSSAHIRTSACIFISIRNRLYRGSLLTLGQASFNRWVWFDCIFQNVFPFLIYVP